MRKFIKILSSATKIDDLKKIIFIHLLNDYSGSPKVLSQVIKATQDKGFNNELFTGKSTNGFLSKITKNHHFYFYKRFDNKYLTLLTYTLSQLNLFLKLLKFRNEDITIYANTMLPFGAALAGKVMGKPVFYHIHETSIKPELLKKFLRFIVKQTASKIIFVSDSLKETESFSKIEQTVIYNTLPEEFASKAKENQHKLQQVVKDGFNVLMICSLKAYKGVGEFVEIAKLCEFDQKIKFTLILNVGQKEIDDYFLNIWLPTNISIVATQKDLHGYYQNTSLLLNLSRVDQWVETFGLTILEAMSYGIPVIVPPVGGPAEIVTNGEEGYLISSYEIGQIAEKIKELSINSSKWDELSKNAQKRSLDFNEKTFNTKILKVLNE